MFLITLAYYDIILRSATLLSYMDSNSYIWMSKDVKTVVRCSYIQLCFHKWQWFVAKLIYDNIIGSIGTYIILYTRKQRILNESAFFECTGSICHCCSRVRLWLYNARTYIYMQHLQCVRIVFSYPCGRFLMKRTTLLMLCSGTCSSRVTRNKTNNRCGVPTDTHGYYIISSSVSWFMYYIIRFIM